MPAGPRRGSYDNEHDPWHIRALLGRSRHYRPGTLDGNVLRLADRADILVYDATLGGGTAFGSTAWRWRKLPEPRISPFSTTTRPAMTGSLGRLPK